LLPAVSAQGKRSAAPAEVVAEPVSEAQAARTHQVDSFQAPLRELVRREARADLDSSGWQEGLGEVLFSLRFPAICNWTEIFSRTARTARHSIAAAAVAAVLVYQPCAFSVPEPFQRMVVQEIILAAAAVAVGSLSTQRQIYFWALSQREVAQ